MQNRVGLGQILLGYKPLCRSIIVIDRHIPLPSQAKTYFDQLNHNPNQVTLQRFEAGLRMALLWRDFETNFNPGDEVEINDYALAAILSEEIFSPNDIEVNHIWQRELVTDIDEARHWLARFIMAMEELQGGADFDINTEPHSFYLRGPIPALPLGITEYPELQEAAIPQLDITEGQLRFVRTVDDNLVSIQLRLLDQDERVIRRYAYDHSCPTRFAVYSYAEEEKRQFDYWNKQLVPMIKMYQEESIAKLKILVQKLIGHQEFSLTDLPLDFIIAGPARAIRLMINDQVSCNFGRLDLSAGGEVYLVKSTIGHFPITGRKTIKITFIPLSQEGKVQVYYKVHVYYFDFANNDFTQIFTRKVDDKGRIVLPHNLICPVWDDGEENRIIL